MSSKKKKKKKKKKVVLMGGDVGRRDGGISIKVVSKVGK